MLAALALFTSLPPAEAQSLTSAFTYQGRLNDTNGPANGVYDFQSLIFTNATPGLATIWWTPPTPGFTLQSTDSLAPTNWINAPSGTNNPATVPATLPARFYRLFKP